MPTILKRPLIVKYNSPQSALGNLIMTPKTETEPSNELEDYALNKSGLRASTLENRKSKVLLDSLVRLDDAYDENNN